MVSAAARSRLRRTLDPALVAALGAGLVAFALCIWRLMPGVGFWDTAEFQMVGPVLGTAHPTGYPSYVLVGWLASILLTPLGEAALRMNVLSAILLAVAVAVTVDLARRLSGSLILGVVAGLGTAVTPIVWAIGTHADPHALHVAFLAVILWLLVRWEQSVRGNAIEPDEPPDDTHRADRLLIAAAVVVGLAVGNHSLTLLLGPPIVLFVLAVDPGILRRRGFIAANVAAFLIPTILVRLEMVLRAGWLRAPFVYANPSTWDGFWYVTLGAQFHSWLTDPFANPGKRIADLADLTVGQFGPIAWLVLVAAIVTGFRQPRYAILSGTTMVLTLFFNSVYPDGAIDRYYIGPTLIAWTWLAILARTAVDLVVAPGGLLSADGVLGRGGAGRPWLRAAALGVAGLGLLVPSIGAFPARAATVDDTGDVAARIWSDQVLAALEPNAVVVSWWSYSTTLWYAQVVDDRRPDVCIIDDRNRLDYDLGELSQVIDRYLTTRPVYLIRNGDSELPALVGRYLVTSVGLPAAGNLLRVTPIAGAHLRAGGPLLGGPIARPAPGRPVANTPALREDCP